MLNQYVWDLYLKSGGSEVVNLFQRNLGEELSEEYVHKIVQLQKNYCVMANIAEETGDQLSDLIAHYSSDSKTDFNVSSPEEMLESIYEDLLETGGSSAVAFDIFAESLSGISTDLAIAFPDSFIPYYYRLNFNVLQKIADTYNISLPDIPLKQDFKGRVFYYLDICKACPKLLPEENSFLTHSTQEDNAQPVPEMVLVYWVFLFS